MAGMAGFIAASLLCGISPGPVSLIISRILQGITAALMVPQVITYIQIAFPPQERQIALSIYGAVIGLANVTGQIAGGLLLKLDVLGLGWRSIFLINLPIGLMALVGSIPFIQLKGSSAKEQLDLTGVFFLSCGLFLFIFPVVIGRELGWPDWMFLCLVLSFLFFIVFLFYEHTLMN